MSGTICVRVPPEMKERLVARHGKNLSGFIRGLLEVGDVEVPKGGVHVEGARASEKDDAGKDDGRDVGRLETSRPKATGDSKRVDKGVGRGSDGSKPDAQVRDRVNPNAKGTAHERWLARNAEWLERHRVK